MNAEKTARPRGTDSAKVIQVIVTEALEGLGTEADLCKIQKAIGVWMGNYWPLGSVTAKCLSDSFSSAIEVIS